MITRKGLALGLAVFVSSFLATTAFAGSWSTRSAGGMSVEVYTPTTAPHVASGRALMVNLHGCAQQNTELRDKGNWQGVADEYGMVVAIPAVPDGGVLFSCWDYYEEDHTRDNRHNDNVLDLVDALLADGGLNIDANQVFLSGLSSGAGQTMVLVCLAPEVFAGVGIAAGPTIGTSSYEISSPATSAQAARDLCLRFAGNNADAFQTQIASIYYGDIDSLVGPGYGPINAATFSMVYGLGNWGANKDTFNLADHTDGVNKTQGTLWTLGDGQGERVSLIENTGVDHSWPAGTGGGRIGSWTTGDSIDYPGYLTAWLFANNRRVDQNGAPRIDDLSATASDSSATVSGRVSDPEGSQIDVTVRLANSLTGDSVSDTVSRASGQSFSLTFNALRDGSWNVSVTAADVEGADGSAETQVYVGELSAPVFSSYNVSSDGGCVLISGSVSDADGDLASVSLSVDGASVAQIALGGGSDSFSHEECGVAPGTGVASARAVDQNGLSATAEGSYDISVRAETATLFAHINAGRLGWGDFLTYYTRYGLDPFTLYSEDGSSWSDTP